MINVALLGFGRIGQMHAENINKNKDLRLLYVYEKVDQLSKKAKHLYNCKIQTNYNKIFSDKDVDIIFISSPTNTHIKFIEEGMKFKKTIFCEKPLDLNIDKIIKTFKKVKKLRPKIQLGFNRRYDPGHFSIKRDLESNKIGKLEKIIITSRDPAPPPISYLKASGGLFRDMMIHDFDLCRFYLKKDEISEVQAFSSSFEHMYKKINDHELAVVTMKSKKGVLCVITNSRHCSFGYDQRIELFGKKGMLLSGNKKINATELYNANQSSSEKPFLNFFIERYSDAYSLQLKELVSLHKNKINSRSTFKDGYMALKLANACYKSLKLKKTIKV
jgi:myo-inositol 2-dehydrogenase/D-chiro-inositol 1-dehydrogenase|tara:strand:- start:260 stop:1252 length:993 start_codon:yes stop_codon:yes gene_type:complete